MLVFLFIGVFDLGFYSYALISMENAVRVAALRASATTGTASDQAGACTSVLREMRSLPNVARLGTSFDCQSAPLIVSATLVPGTSSPDGAAASQVSVTYQSSRLIPIPGLLAGRLALTRTAVAKVRS
jgi:hypothetical protein